MSLFSQHKAGQMESGKRFEYASFQFLCKNIISRLKQTRSSCTEKLDAKPQILWKRLDAFLWSHFSPKNRTCRNNIMQRAPLQREMTKKVIKWFGK